MVASDVHPTDAAADGGVLSDSQIVDFLETVNEAEVAAGQSAATKAVYASVRSFATEMVSAHSSANQALIMTASSLGDMPEPSAPQIQIQTTSAQAAAMLAALTGTAFDRAYVAAQVTAHQHVLAVIDSVLLPDVQNDQLKAQVQAAQALVSMHLAMAQALAATIADGGAGTGDGSASLDGSVADDPSGVADAAPLSD